MYVMKFYHGKKNCTTSVIEYILVFWIIFNQYYVNILILNILSITSIYISFNPLEVALLLLLADEKIES